MQPKIQWKATVGILFIIAILLAACNGAVSNKTTNNLTPATADKQILRQPNEGGDFSTLDPALTNITGDPWNIIFTGLVTATADGSIVDQLAASHQVSADGLTYTFTLRPNLKFSDGTALTADDVAYSINRAVLPATKSDQRIYLQLLKDFDRVTSGKIPTLIGDSLIVRDPTTISILINKPAAYFLQALSYPTSYVVEKKLIDKYGDTWTDHLQEGGGDGPFKVASYGHTSSLDLIPNPGYYGLQPKLQKIKYVIAGDRDSNYKAYEASQYDLAPVPPTQIDLASKQSGFQIVPALGIRYIDLNYLVKPLDNLKIRQALALAINKSVIVRQIIGRLGIASNHIVPNGIPGYDANLTGPAGVTSLSGDQQKAQQLFKEGLLEAGYSSADKLPLLTFSYSTNNPASARVVAAVAEEWKQVLGFNVKLVGQDGTVLLPQIYSTRGHTGPLQIWYGNWGADYADPQDWLSLFFGKGSDHNYVSYGQNTTTDAVQQQAVQAELDQADGEQNSAMRKQLYNDAEQKIVNDVGWIALFQTAYGYAVNPKLQNWKINPLGVLAPNDWGNIYFTQ